MSDDSELRLDDSFVEDILSWSESSTFETKRVSSRNDRKLETILAFANTEGGVLALGIEDSAQGQGRDRVYGVEENPESVDELRRLVLQRFTPPMGPPDGITPAFVRVPCTLRDGSPGAVMLVHVRKSPVVHSFVNGGTWVRFDKSNRQLSAAEITELSLRRGSVSYVAQPVDVPLDLVDTPLFRDYIEARRLTRPFPLVLESIGLGKQVDGSLVPTRGAVLLFADDPGALLDAKCAVRIFQYKGDRVERDADTNLVRPPISIRGPLLNQIRDATDAVVAALASGVRVGPLGFEVVQDYPLRVVREAITNAILHRDYFVQQDIHVRIFDNRIEVVSPGGFPGSVTQQNIRTAGSHPRNRQLVDHLREFPTPPNLDAGEGVPMMHALMAKASLYPPFYVARPGGRDAVLVVLLNEAMPSAWRQVERYLEVHGSIGNAEVRKLLKTDDLLRASKQLKAWVDAGLLELVDPSVGKSKRRYKRPGATVSDRFLALEKTNGEKR